MNVFCYLHTNGNLIFKTSEPEVEPGGFVRRVWPFESKDRRNAWRIVLEALALGANKDCVEELATIWQITRKDLPEYLIREKDVTDERREGLQLLYELWGEDFNTDFGEPDTVSPIVLDVMKAITREELRHSLGGGRKGN